MTLKKPYEIYFIVDSLLSVLKVYLIHLAALILVLLKLQGIFILVGDSVSLSCTNNLQALISPADSAITTRDNDQNYTTEVELFTRTC